MQFNINRTYFHKALARSQRVVEKKNTLAVLANVLIVAQDNCITLTSTDLELVIVERLTAEVITPGQITVPAVMLGAIISKLRGDQDVNLQIINEQFIVKYGKSQFILGTLDAKTFPSITKHVSTHDFTLPSAQLSELLSKTHYAISTDETLYYLNGVHLHSTDTHDFKAIASDTHRMALMSMHLPNKTTKIPGVTISRKTVTEVLRLIDEQISASTKAKGLKNLEQSENIDNEVHISISDTQISFDFATSLLTSRLIDGNFPDYPQVIPKTHDFDLMVVAEDFCDAISRVSVVLPQKTSSICLKLTENKMKICSMPEEQIFYAEEEIQVIYEGLPFEIGFNAEYLQEAMTNFSAEHAQLYFKEANDPLLIRDPQDDSLLFVVMPVRI